MYIVCEETKLYKILIRKIIKPVHYSDPSTYSGGLKCVWIIKDDEIDSSLRYNKVKNKIAITLNIRSEDKWLLINDYY